MLIRALRTIDGAGRDFKRSMRTGVDGDVNPCYSGFGRVRTHASGRCAMLQDRFVPPSGAFTRSVTVRFSHCDPAGIVYFPHYFDIFNGLIEDWYGEELGYNYAKLIMGSQFGFPFVHIDCDFKIPSRMGDIIDLTLLVERVGR